jgi:hypothetical protein
VDIPGEAALVLPSCTLQVFWRLVEIGCGSREVWRNIVPLEPNHNELICVLERVFAFNFPINIQNQHDLQGEAQNQKYV